RAETNQVEHERLVRDKQGIHLIVHLLKRTFENVRQELLLLIAEDVAECEKFGPEIFVQNQNQAREIGRLKGLSHLLQVNRIYLLAHTAHAGAEVVTAEIKRAERSGVLFASDDVLDHGAP